MSATRSKVEEGYSKVCDFARRERRRKSASESSGADGGDRYMKTNRECESRHQGRHHEWVVRKSVAKPVDVCGPQEYKISEDDEMVGTAEYGDEARGREKEKSEGGDEKDM